MSVTLSCYADDLSVDTVVARNMLCSLCAGTLWTSSGVCMLVGFLRLHVLQQL